MMNQATYSLPPTYTRDEIAGPKTIKKQMLRNEHICISLITFSSTSQQPLITGHAGSLRTYVTRTSNWKKKYGASSRGRSSLYSARSEARSPP